MGGVPWKDILEVVRFLGYIALGITAMKLVQTIIVEVFTRTCRHCGKRV